MVMLERLRLSLTLLTLSLEKERGKRLQRGTSPLSYLHSPLPLIREGGQGDRF